jgi:beta-glucanase (GH16 family)
MKKINIIPVLIFFLYSCYNDTDIVERIDNLETRVTALEETCRTINANIKSLESIVNAVSSGDQITNIANIYSQDGNTIIGYTLTMKDGSPITIYHGKDGKDGTNGTDGHTPVIGIEKDTDGIYYWTLDGKWMISGGSKICAIGKDGTNGKDGVNGKDGENGKDGVDGKDGKNGITPKLKIEINPADNNIPYWFITYDNGETWQILYRAVGNDGKNGKDGENGTDGTNGKDGDSFFKGVSVSEDGSKLVIVLNDSDSTTYSIPISSETISSLIFIPRYDDGKANIEYDEQNQYCFIDAEFKVLPKEMVSTVLAKWKSTGENITADYTIVKLIRSASLFPVIVSDVSSSEEGIIKVRMKAPDVAVSNLEQIRISLSIQTSTGTTSSEYFPIYSDKDLFAYIPDPNPAPQTLGSYVYAWGDEFNTEDVGVNENLWQFEEGFIRGNEKQYYQKDNAAITGGRLLITGKKEKVRNAFYDASSGDYRKNTEYSEYTSSSILGKGKRHFLFGRIEVRAKITPSDGAFPAIWTCGFNKNWPQNGEIDIMEYYLTGGNPVLTSNFCVGGNQNGADGEWAQNWKSFFTPLSDYTAINPDWINKYHVYRMDWDENYIRLYVDDVPKNTVDIQAFKNWDGSIAFHNPQFMMLNLAIKDHGAGIDENQKFEVDYFRVYQKVSDIIPPSKVEGLAVSDIGTTSCKLKWNSATDAGSGILRYDIYKDGIGDGYFIGSTTGTETEFTVTGLPSGETMELYVMALDKAGNHSAMSKDGLQPVTVTTQEITEYTGGDYDLNAYNLVIDGKMETLPTDLNADLSSYGYAGSWGNQSWGTLRILTGGNWGKYAQITNDGGELSFSVTLSEGKTYVLRALINANGDNFEISVSDKVFSIPNTAGKWIKFEREFIPGGEALETKCSLHNWIGGGVVKIDNWELYEK